MNKKTIIEVVVILGAFVGSGIVLYNGLFANSQPPGTVGANLITATDAGAPGKLLPYGPNFDYKKMDDLHAQGFQFGAVNYPVLSTSTDVGKASVSDLISPQQSTNP